MVARDHGGSLSLLLTPLELIERPASLIPPLGRVRFPGEFSRFSRLTSSEKRDDTYLSQGRRISYPFPVASP
jgi:hypothetical protein